MMFTGIIERKSRITSLNHVDSGGKAIRMTVEMGPLSRGVRTGQSIAIDGVCLTVTRRLAGNKCAFDIIGQTAKLTSLSSLMRGDSVNVERSMKANSRVEGHFVLGHVDATGKITTLEKKKTESVITISVPGSISKQLVTRGSVAINGVSMTIAQKRKSTITVHVIPHTLKLTNLSDLDVGDLVNIETDILAKYGQRQLLK